jgi:hypothetical protein
MLAPRKVASLRGGPYLDRRVFPGEFPVLDAAFGPHLGMRAPAAGDLDVPGRVAVDQLLEDGEVQCRAQGGPQVVERGRRLRLALAVGGLGDLGEHRAQQRPIQVAESAKPPYANL